MLSPQKIIAVALFSLFVGFLVYTSQLSQPETPKVPEISTPTTTAQIPPTDANPKKLTLTTNAQCQKCHPQIYADWKRDEHSTAWTEDAFVTYTENHKRIECLSCHAPKPMLEVGIEKEPELRTVFKDDGVGCISCHMKNGKSHGTLGSNAPCGGLLEPDLKTSQACYHCHHTHNLFKEYLASSYYKKGVTCQDCHMKEVERAVAVGGKPRKTRLHTIHAGAHDTNAIKKALTIDLKEKNGTLTVTVTNVGAAHGIPGEINNRIVRLELTHLIPARPREGEKTFPGELEEVWAREEIFRAPPRLSRNKIPSTQIMPDHPTVLTYKLAEPKGTITATLSFIIDSDQLKLKADATFLMKKELKF